VPYPKGVSGNPGGRSKQDLEFIAAVKKAAKKCLENIQAIANDRNNENYFKANQWIAERAHGKAAQAVEISGEGGGPIRAVLEIGFGSASKG
jgi:hypothetical protein